MPVLRQAFDSLSSTRACAAKINESDFNDEEYRRERGRRRKFKNRKPGNVAAKPRNSPTTKEATSKIASIKSAKPAWKKVATCAKAQAETRGARRAEACLMIGHLQPFSNPEPITVHEVEREVKRVRRGDDNDLAESIFPVQNRSSSRRQRCEARGGRIAVGSKNWFRRRRESGYPPRRRRSINDLISAVSR